MIVRDSLKAKENPVISEFIQLVEETVADGVLSFSDLQEKKFMRFWRRFLIAEYVEDKNDFKIVFFGTELPFGHSKDWTGYLLSEMDFGESEDTIRQLHLDVLNNNKRTFNSGTFKWSGREYKEWDHVKMPLKRGDRIIETLTYVAFE